MSFKEFKTAVAQRFAEMSKGELFTTNATKDGLWQTYLTSFPAGTNPIFRERTEHDCNCCKQFVRAVGNVVSIKDDKGVGNKHYFFMLDNCLNDGKARGFFNEFLKDELTPHRKVIEMVGAKMLTDKSEQQLSGVGFSSTARNNILCRVKGAFTRTINITF